MRRIWQLALLATAIVAMTPGAMAQDVTGDAVAGLVSRQAKGEVHLLIDPKLANGRLVLRIVVLNRSNAPAPFAPSDVHVTTPEGAPIALVPRETLLAEQAGGGQDRAETSQAHAAPAMPVNGAGQTDVSGFTGGMGATTANVPQSAIERPRASLPAIAALDAVLLKPIVLKPGAADGGQVVTGKLARGKVKIVKVAISFAGEEHRFQVETPKR
jgi:hypothetical protein